MKIVLLLLLSLAAYTLCSSSYTVTSSAAITYASAKATAWGTTNPSGGCAHLATYETSTQLASLMSTAITASAGKAYSFFLGAQKEPNSNTFIWAVGPRRGQPFFSANVISYYDTTHSFYDINYESGFICHQAYCFEPHKFEGYKLVYDATTEAIAFVYVTDYNVEPFEAAATVTYLAIEYENPGGFIANALGGSKFSISFPTTAYYDANQAAIAQGTYLARISSQTQLNWILDEVQCVAAGTQYWLGYEVDYVTGDVIFSAGPSQAQVLYDSAIGCVTDVFCPYTPSKKRGASSFSYVPHYYQDKRALVLDVTSKTFKDITTGSTAGFIVQAEYCSINSNNFFRFNFAENVAVDTRVCTPNPSTNWANSLPDFDGRHDVFNDHSFFAGSAQTFVNDLYTTPVKKTLYFDCNCRTDPKIDLACLGSDAFPGCDLYTDATTYYVRGKYANRLIGGINYTYDRLKEYRYWKALYNYF